LCHGFSFWKGQLTAPATHPVFRIQIRPKQ